MQRSNRRNLTFKRRQRQFERARSIEALKAQKQILTEELDAKIREAELDDAAELVRTESHKNTIAQRLLMRRATDDMPAETERMKEPTGDEL